MVCSPDRAFDILATWATTFTLIGAVCFLVGAYLMWPEMAAKEQAAEEQVAEEQAAEKQAQS